MTKLIQEAIKKLKSIGKASIDGPDTDSVAFSEGYRFGIEVVRSEYARLREGRTQVWPSSKG